MRHQGDGPVSRHLPELVARAADNAQPKGPPSTLTCSRKGTWTSYPAAQARYANALPADMVGNLVAEAAVRCRADLDIM